MVPLEKSYTEPGMHVYSFTGLMRQQDLPTILNINTRLRKKNNVGNHDEGD